MEHIIMWICDNCGEPNSVDGIKCPYCLCKMLKPKREVFYFGVDWIKEELILIDKVLRKIEIDTRWIDKIPDNTWKDISKLEKEFLLNIQEKITKIDK